jgi:hypothetical protein
MNFSLLPAIETAPGFGRSAMTISNISGGDDASSCS